MLEYAKHLGRPIRRVAVAVFVTLTLAGCESAGRSKSTSGASSPASAPSAPAPEIDAAAIPHEGTTNVKIRLITDEEVLTATLIDSAATRDFVAMLPLELTLRDYASTEKVSDLPKRLGTEGSPAGVDPDVGDITYYAPWGNLAIFYRDFGYAKGLVKLGRIDSGIEKLGRASGEVVVRVELQSAP